VYNSRMKICVCARRLIFTHFLAGFELRTPSGNCSKVKISPDEFLSACFCVVFFSFCRKSEQHRGEGAKASIHNHTFFLGSRDAIFSFSSPFLLLPPQPLRATSQQRHAPFCQRRTRNAPLFLRKSSIFANPGR